MSPGRDTRSGANGFYHAEPGLRPPLGYADARIEQNVTQWPDAELYMTHCPPSFALPARIHTGTGELRRVGVELEMSGLDIDRLATICSRYLQLPSQATSRYERTLRGDPAGDWRVELDFTLLRDMGREQRAENDLGDELRTSVEELL